MPAIKPIRSMVKPGFYLTCILGTIALFLLVIAGSVPDAREHMTQLKQLEERVHTAETRSLAHIRELTQKLEASERERLKLATKVTELEKTAKVRTSVEKFDPTTGKLTERATTRIVTTEKKREADKTRTSDKTKTTTQTQTTAETKTDTTVKTTETTKTDTAIQFANKRSGVGVGVLAMGSGFGPAASINLGRVGPAGVDVTLGAVGLPSRVSPRLGVQFTVEPVPNLTIGAGPFLSVPDDPLGYAPPGFPAGVAPGLTVQYRF